MEGKKNDFLDKKLRWDLLPLQEIEDIVRVYTAGANKYGDNNWQHLDNGYQRYKAAMLRHLLEYEKGNVYDEETGCRHLAQVAWNAIAMLYLSKKDKTLEALDKRISEKIDKCNSILDEIHLKKENDNAILNAANELMTKSELDNRDKLENEKFKHNFYIKKLFDLQRTLSKSTDFANNMQIEKDSINFYEGANWFGVIYYPDGKSLDELNGSELFNVYTFAADMVSKKIIEYEHNKGESGTGDDDLSAEDC